LSHSHLPVQHLIRQVEAYGERRQSQQRLPEWLLSFVHNVAERFEPFSGVARPGYECQQVDERWEVSVFLGKMELVGGAQDGAAVPVNFRFDLRGLMSIFDELTSIQWNAFPDCCAYQDDVLDLSFISAEGLVGGQPVIVQIHAGPPETATPALRQHADGSFTIHD
jgi:hypothetical protein